MRLFLKQFFSLLYNQFAGLYDLVASIVSLGRWNDWILLVIPHLVGSKILELGHGPGHLQIALYQKGFNPVGIDPSIQMGRITSRRLSRKGIHHKLVRAKSQSLPLADRSFDSVIATFPTNYIFEWCSILEIYRVLVPGGRLVFIPSAWITSSRVLDRLAAIIFRITDQAPGWQEELSTPFIRAGFQLKTNQEDIYSSKVLVITAVKPE